MNIDERLNKMKPKDTPLLVLGYIILGMFLLIPATANAQDNEVLLDQSGDNLDLQILQAGYGNTVKNLQLTNAASLNSTSMNLTLQQLGNNNDIGLWSSGSDQNVRGHIDGDWNDLFMDAHGDAVSLQADVIGDYNYAWLEAGGSNSHVSNAIQLYQAGDNHYAYLEVSNSGGTYNNIDAYQGNGQDDNYIYAYINSNSDSNNLKIWQGKHEDGTTDVDEVGDHEAYWTVTGDSNTLASYQTDTNRSSGGAGHHLSNIITGNSNNVDHTQMGKAGHDGFIEIDGNSNTVDLYQRGNGGVKWADIVLDGNGHTVDVNQRGGNAGTAAIDLTYGSGAYTFDLSQNLTSSSATYSITGICNNSGGCSLTVNQNN